MFPHAKIIIDKFHIINLISTSLNKTRIKLMKKSNKDYKKLKRYWRLILKPYEELNNSKWQKYTCFKDMMTQVDVVNYLINSNIELKDTYDIYQSLLESIKKNNYNLLKNTLFIINDNISDYMKTSIKTLKNYLVYIQNTLSNPYSNGYVEGNNNFIKVLKRIAFGFRSFRRFKARIMICKGLINSIKNEA